MKRIAAILVALLAAGAGVALWRIVARGVSARDEPTALEAFVARRVRRLAIPRAARAMTNPLEASPALLAEARAHFADHCALCHGNDGHGQTAIGQGLYPRAPDMAGGDTQALSDGEIFAIIENGVRLTGMPAWGHGTAADTRDTWALVHFIRHLPRITPAELEEMKALNPASRREIEEAEAEKRFLEGGGADAAQDPRSSPRR